MRLWGSFFLCEMQLIVKCGIAGVDVALTNPRGLISAK
ncbi:hypothetical protein SAMN05428962_0076 [Paenibacillus sp. BC26]|nr:hypothetical protein SAMN05428962_0076 [Paenibacillus sp. BC26]